MLKKLNRGLATLSASLRLGVLALVSVGAVLVALPAMAEPVSAGASATASPDIDDPAAGAARLAADLNKTLGTADIQVIDLGWGLLLEGEVASADQVSQAEEMASAKAHRGVVANLVVRPRPMDTPQAVASNSEAAPTADDPPTAATHDEAIRLNAATKVALVATTPELPSVQAAAAPPRSDLATEPARNLDRARPPSQIAQNVMPLAAETSGIVKAPPGSLVRIRDRLLAWARAPVRLAKAAVHVVAGHLRGDRQLASLGP